MCKTNVFRKGNSSKRIQPSQSLRPGYCCTTSADPLSETPDDDWGATWRLLAGVDKKTPVRDFMFSWHGFVHCKQFSAGNFGCLVRMRHEHRQTGEFHRARNARKPTSHSVEIWHLK